MSTKNTAKFCMEIISYRQQQLWNLFPNNIKLKPALELLKKKNMKMEM